MELRRLYAQMQVLKTKAMRKDNPHISKKKGGRKMHAPHRRWAADTQAEKLASGKKLRRYSQENAGFLLLLGSPFKRSVPDLGIPSTTRRRPPSRHPKSPPAVRKTATRTSQPSTRTTTPTVPRCMLPFLVLLRTHRSTGKVSNLPRILKT
jgi:hypothetical protein